MGTLLDAIQDFIPSPPTKLTEVCDCYDRVKQSAGETPRRPRGRPSGAAGDVEEVAATEKRSGQKGGEAKPRVRSKKKEKAVLRKEEDASSVQTGML